MISVLGDSERGSGCTLLWRCDSPSDYGANLSILVMPSKFKRLESYYLVQTPVRVDTTQLLPRTSHRIKLPEYGNYNGEYAKFDVQNDDSLLLYHIEASRPLFNYYTKHRVNHLCGDEICAVFLRNGTWRSCWILVGGHGQKMKGSHYLQLVPLYVQHESYAVVNASEISMSPDPILPLMQLREYEVSIGDFISFQVETSVANFSAALLPANYSISIYGMNPSLYRAWITSDGPKAPHSKLLNFGEDERDDLTTFVSDFPSVMGKKLFVNLLFISTVPFDLNSVYSVAIRASIVPLRTSQANLPLTPPAEGQIFHVDLIPGYPTKLIWKPSKKELGKRDIFSVEIFNVTGSGYFTGQVFPASGTDSLDRFDLKFVSSRFWDGCSLGSRLADSYLIELSSELIMEPSSFDLKIGLRTATKMSGSHTSKHVRKEGQVSTRVYSLESQDEKASAFAIHVGEGNDVLVRMHPFNSAGCFVKEPTTFHSFSCASKQSCFFSSLSVVDRWQQSHSGAVGFCTPLPIYPAPTANLTEVFLRCDYFNVWVILLSRMEHRVWCLCATEIVSFWILRRKQEPRRRAEGSCPHLQRRQRA
jgi:hypothetical protein